MHTYELRYPDARPNDEAAVEFQAVDVCEALIVIQKKAEPKRLELWEDGRKLCDLTRSRVDGDDLWIVGNRVEPSSSE